MQIALGLHVCCHAGASSAWACSFPLDVPQRGRAVVAASQVRGALCDDLNTPQAVSALSAPLKALNDLLHTKKVPRITSPAP